MATHSSSFVLNFCLTIVAQFRVVALLDSSYELLNCHAESNRERSFSNYFALTCTNSNKIESWANLSGSSDHGQFSSGSTGSYFHHLTPCVLTCECGLRMRLHVRVHERLRVPVRKCK